MVRLRIKGRKPTFEMNELKHQFQFIHLLLDVLEKSLDFLHRFLSRKNDDQDKIMLKIICLL